MACKLPWWNLVKKVPPVGLFPGPPHPAFSEARLREWACWWLPWPLGRMLGGLDSRHLTCISMHGNSQSVKTKMMNRGVEEMQSGWECSCRIQEGFSAVRSGDSGVKGTKVASVWLVAELLQPWWPGHSWEGATSPCWASPWESREKGCPRELWGGFGEQHTCRAVPLPLARDHHALNLCPAPPASQTHPTACHFYKINPIKMA